MDNNTYTPLTEDQFNRAKAAGFSFDEIVKFEKQRKADILAKSQTPPPDPNETPTFNASIGGAETIPTNVAKMVGNIPSNINSLGNELVAKPLQDVKNSAIAVKDIYKNRGVIQGTKDIAGALSDAGQKMERFPGEFLDIAGRNNKMDLQQKLSPIQEQTLKQRDDIIKKLADAHAQGKDTSHLVLALKYNQENLDALNTQIDTKENRDKSSVDTATNIAKYPIERPVDIPLELATWGESGAGGRDLIRDIAKPVKKVAGTAAEYASDSLLGRTLEKKTADELTRITETIAPAPTSKEIKLAQQQGRLIAGKPETFFRSSTADTILPSKNVQKAGSLIQQEIPNAGKLTEPELYSSLKSKTSEIAQNLRPDMETTSVKPQTIQKINDDVGSLRKQLIKDSLKTEEGNVAKRQDAFEEILRKGDINHQGDLWDMRINYDESIPEKVKKANSLSSDSLIAQKEEWLQRREVLNKAIHDTENEMSVKSKKAFSDMSLLYDSKENLLAKSKLNVDIKPSKLYQKLTGKTAKTIGLIATGAGVSTGLLYGAQQVLAGKSPTK